MATHSSILTWRIAWTEEPGGLQSIGLQRVRHDWSDLAGTFTMCLTHGTCSISIHRISGIQLFVLNDTSQIYIWDGFDGGPNAWDGKVQPDDSGSSHGWLSTLLLRAIAECYSFITLVRYLVFAICKMGIRYRTRSFYHIRCWCSWIHPVQVYKL